MISTPYPHKNTARILCNGAAAKAECCTAQDGLSGYLDCLIFGIADEMNAIAFRVQMCDALCSAGDKRLQCCRKGAPTSLRE